MISYTIWYGLKLISIELFFFISKNVYVEVREQGACSLWAIAGNTRTQQKYIAERITIPHIIQMLLEPTEKLLYVGKKCISSLVIAFYLPLKEIALFHCYVKMMIPLFHCYVKMMIPLFHCYVKMMIPLFHCYIKMMIHLDRTFRLLYNS